MITINLISPEHKKQLKTQRMFIILREIILLILLFTSIIAIMLWSSRYFLEEKLAELIRKNAQAINVNQDVNNKIKILNNKIDNSAVIQNDWQKWSVLVAGILELTPANIYYRNLNIFQETATVEISGQAKTRNDLLELQKKFQGSNLFKKVDIPLTSFLNKENNDFTLQATIDLAKIK